MKKTIFIILFFLITSPMLGNELLVPVVGEFVYYRINRGNSKELLGLAYFGENLLRVRYYKDGKNYIINIKHEGLTSNFQYQSKVIYPRKYDKSIVQNIIFEIEDIIKDRYKIDMDSFPSAVSVNMNNRSLVFEYWVPLIHLRKLESSVCNFTLIKLGRMKKPDDPRFYKFEEKNRTPKIIKHILPDYPKLKVEHNSLSAIVPKNWIKKTDEHGSTAYVLSEYTGRDAYLVLEEVDLNKISTKNIQFFIKNYLLMNNDTIIAESIKIAANEKNSVSYTTFNPEKNTETMHFSLSTHKKGKIWNAVTLSVFKSLYSENQDYFDSLLNSIQFK